MHAPHHPNSLSLSLSLSNTNANIMSGGTPDIHSIRIEGQSKRAIGLVVPPEIASWSGVWSNDLSGRAKAE